MKHGVKGTNRECQALLEEGRAIRPVSDVVRARALLRARNSMAAGIEATPSVTPVMPAPRSHRTRIAAMAACAVLAGAAGAIAAMHGGMLDKIFRPLPAPAVPDRRISPRAPVMPRALAPTPTPTPIAPVSEGRRPGRHVSPAAQESYAAELALLHRAQVAYASQEYSVTVGLVAEHARRFPNGRLAEERDALRVRSLARSGRTDEARRAADEFAAHFPRSVLLPRLKEAAQK